MPDDQPGEATRPALLARIDGNTLTLTGTQAEPPACCAPTDPDDAITWRHADHWHHHGEIVIAADPATT